MNMLWRADGADWTLSGVSAHRMRFMVVFESSGWIVHEVGSRQPMASFPTREEAVRTARHLADLTQAEVLLMNADGTLESRESHELRESA
jgi:hypothetical protein